jgi:hypothetical protein
MWNLIVIENFSLAENIIVDNFERAGELFVDLAKKYVPYSHKYTDDNFQSMISSKQALFGPTSNKPVSIYINKPQTLTEAK